ncbi:MAG TPA: aminoacyl-tRNA hydrolase [Thermoanaerobaculia bacterium]|jgi:PTH1 family peptidyl-tRNA hydrolase|nr:aminoacyl-tRNA hydrolase [Thermoanaerobaculia bacterium]
MRLILGLGNPGEEYRATRHNVGFRVAEELARRWEIPLDRLDCNALAGSKALGEAPLGGNPGDQTVLLAKPQTYMNRSGYAARCFAERFGLEPSAVLVVYDEVNLPLGKLRLRRSGSPAGHRGLESVIENLRSADVPRLRLGVAPREGRPPGGEDLVEFVLSPFAPEELEAVDEMVRRAADACETWVREGAEVAMNRHNG